MHYFFDLRPDDDDWSPDEEGTVLPDIEAARTAALELAAGIMKDEVLRRQQLMVRVQDAWSTPLLVVTLSVSVGSPDEP